MKPVETSFLKLKNFFWPVNCHYCGCNPAATQDGLCFSCRGRFNLDEIFKLQNGPNEICQRCKMPLQGFSPQVQAEKRPRSKFNPGYQWPENRCFHCYDRNIYYDELQFLFINYDPFRKALADLKFYQKPYILSYFQNFLVREFINRNKLGKNLEAWIPVPVSQSTRIKRGENHVVLLFSVLDQSLPRLDCLQKMPRQKDTHLQQRNHRFMSMTDTYGVKQACMQKIQNKNFLLVDDFITSGATVNYLAYELKRNGAANIHVLAAYHNFTQESLGSSLGLMKNKNKNE